MVNTTGAVTCQVSAVVLVGASRIRPDLVNPTGWRYQAITPALHPLPHHPTQRPTMEAVNIYDAKTRLSQLVDRAAAGEDVVVSRNGKPLVRITKLAEPKRTVTFGVLKGKIKLAADFNAPLPADALAGFEGR